VPLPDWLPHEKILEELTKRQVGLAEKTTRQDLVGC